MLDPQRYSLDAATVGFRERMGLPVNWANFSDALQTQTESIKVRRELEETPISEVHVMGGQRFGLAGNSKTNELARQARQMNGYPLRSFYATGGAVVVPQKHGEGLLAIPMNVGLTQYAQYNGVVGNLVSSFTEPLNAAHDSGTMLLARAGVQAKSESITNPYKYLQFMLNMHNTMDQIRQNEQMHQDMRGYNREQAFARGDMPWMPAPAQGMREAGGAGRRPGEGVGVANHLPNIRDENYLGMEGFGYIDPNEPENVRGNPAEQGLNDDEAAADAGLYGDRLGAFWEELERLQASNFANVPSMNEINDEQRRTVRRVLRNMPRVLTRRGGPLHNVDQRQREITALCYLTGYDEAFTMFLLDVMATQEFDAQQAAAGVDPFDPDAPSVQRREAEDINHVSGLPVGESISLVGADDLFPNMDALQGPEAHVVDLARAMQEQNILNNNMRLINGFVESPPSTLSPAINEELAVVQAQAEKDPADRAMTLALANSMRSEKKRKKRSKEELRAAARSEVLSIDPSASTYLSPTKPTYAQLREARDEAYNRLTMYEEDLTSKKLKLGKLKAVPGISRGYREYEETRGMRIEDTMSNKLLREARKQDAKNQIANTSDSSSLMVNEALYGFETPNPRRTSTAFEISQVVDREIETPYITPVKSPYSASIIKSGSKKASSPQIPKNSIKEQRVIADAQTYHANVYGKEPTYQALKRHLDILREKGLANSGSNPAIRLAESYKANGNKNKGKFKVIKA